MSSETDKRICGSVKWYNYKQQYGFITYTNGDGDYEDIFVHSKDIISNKKHKYLNKGEYVEFDIVSYTNINDENEVENKQENSDDNVHKIKAGNITGINKSSLQMEHLNIVFNNSNQQKSGNGWQTVTRRH